MNGIDWFVCHAAEISESTPYFKHIIKYVYVFLVVHLPDKYKYHFVV